MTVTLALLAVTGITVALWLEERSWRRTLRLRARTEMARVMRPIDAQRWTA